MNNTRHRVAAALIAACFATSAFAAGAPDAPPAPEAGAPAMGGPGGPDGGPGAPDGGAGDQGDRGGPGGPGMDGGSHGFGGHGPGAPGPGMPFGGPHGGAGMEGMPPHFHRLNLNEAQQDKLFAIMHAAEPQHRDHGKAIRKAHEALAELGRADRFDDAKASALARDLGQAIAAEALLQARTEAQTLAVLTPEQRDELRKHRSKGPQMRPEQPQQPQPGQQGRPGQGAQQGEQGAQGRP